MTRFIIITSESILYDILGVFIDIASSNEIDGKLIIKMKWRRSSNRNLSGIEEIMKP